jgi:hypothetical protein
MAVCCQKELIWHSEALVTARLSRKYYFYERSLGRVGQHCQAGVTCIEAAKEGDSALRG